MNKRFLIYMTLAVFTLLLSITGITMAAWSIVHVQSGTNEIIAGCFSMGFSEQSASINLTNTYPMSDIKGKKSNPYTFTINNTCTLRGEYYITLDIVDSETNIDLSKIKVSLEGSKRLKPTILNTLNPNNDIYEPEGIRSSYILKKDFLEATTEPKEYSLRIWVDESAGNEVMDKNFEARLTIISIATGDIVMLTTSEVEPTLTDKFLNSPDPLVRNDIESITFVDTNEVPQDAIASWDVSSTGDGKVMAWYKEGPTPGMYHVWIGAKGGVHANSDSSYLFEDLRNLSTVDFTYFDVSRVTSMLRMFLWAGSDSPTFSINLNNWDVSNVINMEGTFAHVGLNSTEVRIVGFSNWDVSNVTSMLGMFNITGYESETVILDDFSNWDVSNVTNMRFMFGSTGFTSPTFTLSGLSNWDVSNVINMYAMFQNVAYNSTVFTLGDLSNWNVSNVTDMKMIFLTAGLNSPVFVLGDLSKWDVSKVEDMSYMFYGTGNINPTFTLGDLSKWNTSKVEDMSYMFSHTGSRNTSFTLGNISNWNVSNVTNMSYMFERIGYYNTNFKLDLRNWDISKVSNMNYMFYNARYLTELRLDNWEVPTATKSNMFTGANNRVNPNNLKVHVKNDSMELWIQTNTAFPANGVATVAVS